MNIRAVEYPTAREAIRNAEGKDEVAIRVEGRTLVVSQVTADNLATRRVSFAYLCDHKGRVMTVPVN